MVVNANSWGKCGTYLSAMPGTSSFSAFADTCANSATANHANSQCDAANLVTILFFSCSNVNEGNLNTFCNSHCFDQVSNFLGKCAGSLSQNGASSVLKQAQSWMAMVSSTALVCVLGPLAGSRRGRAGD